MPDGSCGGNNYLAQTATAGAPGYAVPAGFGVITSWSYEAGTTAGSGKLLIWRPTAVANQLFLVTKTAREDFAIGALRTFLVRLAVQPGDVLGLVNPAPCLIATGSAEDIVRVVPAATEPTEGSLQTASGANFGFRIVVSATVEQDIDADAFGDDTQDKCVGTAGTFNGCPNSVTLDRLKQKGTRPKVKVTTTVPGAGSLMAGSASDPALASAAAKKSLKPMTQTVTSTSKQQVTLTLKLTKSAKHKLSDKGKLKAQVKVVYTPIGGPPGSQTKTAKLRS